LIYRLGADALVVVHLGFVLFVVLGGLLARRRRRLAWLHLAAVAWGSGIELAGGICPLTPIENHLRRLGGQGGYAGDFVARYLLPVLYPGALTHRIQIVLGLAVLLLNLAIYAPLLRRARWARRSRGPAPPPD
jgi:hypothetical protein